MDGDIQSALGFWRGNAALEHITPKDDRWPEGFAVFPALRSLIRGSVLDFGCGDGRMVEAFQPGNYIGVDVNPHAVAYCREKYPDYQFELAGPVLPNADTALCYTVLLHVPDEELGGTVAMLKAAASRVVVVEILGKSWRRPDGVPPCFNRSLGDYARAFGMKILSVTDMPYCRYGGVSITFMEFGK